MATFRQWWVAVSFVGMVVLPSPLTHAQTAQQIAWCGGKSGFEEQIVGCTALIQSGSYAGARLAKVFTFRGSAYGWKQDYDRAIADFDQAIRLDPNLAAAFGSRGEAYRNKGEYDLAMQDYNEAIRLNPNDPASFNNRGIVSRQKGELDRALSDFSEAIRLNPKESKPYSSRGEIWRLKGELERALIDQDEAIRLNPKSSIGYVLRGNTLRYKGDLIRALADFEQALRFSPNYIAALTGRGLTYEKMGDLARARAEFEKALASTHLSKSMVSMSALDTARARLSALNSGAPQPIIPAAPSTVTSATSIPTQTLIIPTVAPTVKPQLGRRVALVIGNSAYKHVAALSNPQRDAEAIASSLRAIGFETVTLADDSTREKLINALRTFADEAEKADWAVVYYAGHGMEVNGVNYLIPVDAKLAVDRDVQFEAVPLDQVMVSVEGAKKLKLILLDACRNNPFAPQMRRTTAPDTAAVTGSTGGGTISARSVGRGLAEVKVSGGTLVVYAAKHGEVALDGEGANSPFAVAVVQRLATPNVEINKLFRLVRDDVMEATAGRQEPYTYGSLPGREDFFFVAK
jgi:tetratricopeptide (TPR) repeat protein